MDVASHGLWGGVVFGRKNRRSFWTAFSFGVAPDMLSFGILFFQRIFTHGLDFSPGPPPMETIPQYVVNLYNVTHSLIVFASIFAIVWIVRKVPFWEMGAWGLHIFMDIFTHNFDFFPTPFLWPIFDYKFSGVSWGHPAIFFTNLAALIVLYFFFWREKRKTMV